MPDHGHPISSPCEPNGSGELITDSMEEFKILNSYERIYLKKAKFMFKISNSLTPDYINEMFHLRPLNNTLQSLRSSAAKP